MLFLADHEHDLHLGRIRLGRKTYGTGGDLYGTTGRCSCGDWETRVNKAPSSHGKAEVRYQWFEHIKALLAQAPDCHWGDTGWSVRRNMRCDVPAAGGRCLRNSTRRFGPSNARALVLCCSNHARMLGDVGWP